MTQPTDPEPTMHQLPVLEGKNTGPIYGPRRIGPTTGNCLRNPNTTGKKSPNKFMNPKSSTAIPTTGHFMKINTTPPKKQNVPRSLCFRAKKYMVFVGPMIKVNPEINRSYNQLSCRATSTFPIANNAPSKNIITPWLLNK